MDDSLSARMIISDLLETEGHDVVLAQTGSEAMQKYLDNNKQQTPIDVCVLDLNCQGGLGGLATLRLLKAADKDVKAIAFSAESREYIQYAYAKSGFVGAVEKSNPKTLLNEINYILDNGV